MRLLRLVNLTALGVYLLALLFPRLPGYPAILSQPSLMPMAGTSGYL
jgi:hypothetical protein